HGFRTRSRHRGPIRGTIGTDLRLEPRSEEHTSELQSRENLVCRLLLEKKNGQRPRCWHAHPPRAPPPRARRAPPLAARSHSARACRGPVECPRAPGSSGFFFLKERGAPEISPFPLPDALPV